MDEHTQLELLRADYTEHLQSACELFVEASQTAAALLTEQSIDLDRLDRQVMRMCLAERRITRLILPARAGPEFFGLPRAVTGHAMDPDPSVRIQDPARESWDFRPWLSEKITYLRENLDTLVETTETLWGLQGSTDEGAWSRSVERASFDARSAGAYAGVILMAIADMGLTVVDWRLTE